MDKEFNIEILHTNIKDYGVFLRKADVVALIRKMVEKTSDQAVRESVLKIADSVDAIGR